MMWYISVRQIRVQQSTINTHTKQKRVHLGGTITSAMSIFWMKGYNTVDGVFGFIAIPTFIPFALICSIRFSISSSECNASMWKQYKSTRSESMEEERRVRNRLLRQQRHRPIDRDLRPSCDSRRNCVLEGQPYEGKLWLEDRLWCWGLHVKRAICGVGGYQSGRPWCRRGASLRHSLWPRKCQQLGFECEEWMMPYYNLWQDWQSRLMISFHCKVRRDPIPARIEGAILAFNPIIRQLHGNDSCSLI